MIVQLKSDNVHGRVIRPSFWLESGDECRRVGPGRVASDRVRPRRVGSGRLVLCRGADIRIWDIIKYR